LESSSTGYSAVQIRNIGGDHRLRNWIPRGACIQSSTQIWIGVPRLLKLTWHCCWFRADGQLRRDRRNITLASVQLTALIRLHLFFPYLCSTHAGVHPVHVSRSFRRTLGCTFREYLTLIRIRRATDLLKQSSTCITEIAFACGFSDHAHFTRTFKLLPASLQPRTESKQVKRIQDRFGSSCSNQCIPYQKPTRGAKR
jgi:AraC-like DNA-binding protein